MKTKPKLLPSLNRIVRPNRFSNPRALVDLRLRGTSSTKVVPVVLKAAPSRSAGILPALIRPCRPRPFEMLLPSRVVVLTQRLATFGLLFLSIALAYAGESTPNEHPSDPGARKLVDAHLKQAQSMEPTRKQPGTDAALEKLKSEIAAKEKAWKDLMARAPNSTDLLAALPKSLLTRVKRISGEAAQTRATLKESVSAPLLLALAAERNPSVHTAFENWRAVIKRFRQASYLEDLVSQYRSFVRELDTKVGPQKHKEMPGKTFAFPSALALKGQIVDAEAEIARLKYVKALREALNATARGFFDVQYTLQAVAIIKENRDLFAQMEEIARQQLKVGNASQADALKAQSMLAILDNRLVTLKGQRLNAIGRVNALLNLPPETEWGALKEADLKDSALSLEAGLKRSREHSQEILMAQKKVTLMEQMVRLAETMIYPRASVGLSQLAPSLGAEAGPTRKPAASFPTRPMVNQRQAAFGVNAAWIDELRIRVKKVREDLVAVLARIDFRTKDNHYQADIGRRDRKTYGELVTPKAKQAFETMRERYNTGKAPFIEYLDAGRGYLDASLTRERARNAHNKGLVDLQDAMGSSAAELFGVRGSGF